MKPDTQKIDDIQKSINSINTGAKELGQEKGVEFQQLGSLNSGANAQIASDKITSNDLNNNKQETVLPNAEPEIASEQLMDTIVDENQTLLDKRVEDAKTEKGQTVSGIQDLIKDIAGEEGKLAGFEEKAGVSQFQEQADTFQQSINIEARSLKNTIDRLANQPSLNATVMNAMVSSATRKSVSHAADLAILRDVSLGNIDRAQATAKAKVDALTAPLKADLDSKKFLLDANKDIWNATEKASLNEDIKVLDRAYNKELREATSLEDQKLDLVRNALEAGASPSKLAEIQGAKDLKELFAIDGIQSYTTSKADRLNNQLLGIKINKAQRESDALTKLTTSEASAEFSAETLKRVEGMDNTQREKFVGARGQLRESNELTELLTQENAFVLLTGLTPEARDFQQRATNIIDQLARERTGAVVNPDEVKAFTKILGLGFGDALISSQNDLIKNITDFTRPIHDTVNAIDPTGEITRFLDSKQGATVTGETPEEAYISELESIGVLSSSLNPFQTLVNDLISK